MASSEKIETHKRYVYLTDTVDEEMAEDTIKALFKFEKDDPTKDIIMIINSYGGYVDSMWAVIDTMQMISCSVHTLVVGKAMSAGATILLSGEKGKRYSTPHSRVMIHQVSGASIGTTSSVEIQAKEMKRMEEECRRHIIDKTKLKAKQLDELLTHDYYMTPDIALKHGLVDKVINNFSEINVVGW